MIGARRSPHGVIAAAAITAAVSLAPLACVPGSQSPDNCSPPYGGGSAFTVSNMVKEPPLSSAFACAVTVWTLTTVTWLRRERRPWLPLLVAGLAFACAPTGEKPKRLWIWHTTLLWLTGAAFLAATLGTVDKAAEARRPRARAHRALLLIWSGAGAALLGVLAAWPDVALWALLRAYGVAAAEIAAAVHLACFQLDIMR